MLARVFPWFIQCSLNVTKDALMIEFAIATILAIALTAALIGIPNAVGAILERRLFRLFTSCRCPSCGHPYTLETVRNGLDTSPFEELRSDGMDDTIHCRPRCRCIVCAQCGQLAEIRYNTQGEFFGPKLAVREPSPPVVVGEDGRPKWNVRQAAEP